MQDKAGKLLYPLLTRLAMALLTIPHSSAGVERNYSQMGADKTTTRNSLSTPVLNSLMTIQCNQGKERCLSFQPTEAKRHALRNAAALAAGKKVEC